MAETVSLESRLITGAGKAVAYDPEGLVAEAQAGAGKQLTEGIKGIGEAFATKKKEREAEIEAEKKKQEDINKGYDDNWEANQTEVIDNQGLGKIAWGQATDLAEEQKVIHDACQPGQEGNRCRRGAIIDLKKMAQKYSDQKGYLEGLVETQGKMNGTHKDGKTLDLSNAQSGDAKKILAGLNDRNSSSRMKNNDEIAELHESLKSANPDDQMGIEQEIEALEKSNERVVGWDIPGADKDGKKFGFMTAEDLDKANLLPVAASDVKKQFGDQTGTAVEIAGNLKTGAKGGKKYDLDKEGAAYGELIDKDNMKSVFKDPLYGGTETLEDHLKKHPVITNMKYSDLGVDVKADENEDGIIDKEEWAKLSASDVDKVINAISDDEDLAKKVGGNYMALKTQRAVNKELYGEEYYPEGNPPYVIKNYLGQADTEFNSTEKYQEALHKDKTTIRGDWENETDLKNRGYIHGLAQSGTSYEKTKRGTVKVEELGNVLD